MIGNANATHMARIGRVLTKQSGTDLSPTQRVPQPPNLKWETDDACSEWVYPPDYFDYVHVRLLYASIADWSAFYKECYE